MLKHRNIEEEYLKSDEYHFLFGEEYGDDYDEDEH
jgi:hypothetical protein